MFGKFCKIFVINVFDLWFVVLFFIVIIFILNFLISFVNFIFDCLIFVWLVGGIG